MAKPKHWYEIKLQNGGAVADLFILDDIGFFGVTAKDFINDVRAAGDVSLRVHISSNGGDPFEGLTMFNFLRRHKQRVEVIIEGMAASAASIVAMAGNPVIMPNNAMMMIHEPSGSMFGTADDAEKLAQALRKINDSVINAYLAKVEGKENAPDRAEMERLLKEETWLTPEEALELGFIDEIEAPMQIAAHWDLSKYRNPPGHLVTCSRGQPKPPAKPRKDNPTMDITELRKSHPDVVTALEAEITQKNAATHAEAIKAATEKAEKDGIEAGTAAGATAERTRVLSILEVPAKGHEELVKAAIADPKATGDSLARRILEADASKRADVANKMHADDPKLPVPTPSPAGEGGDEMPKDPNVLAQMARAVLKEQHDAGNRIGIDDAMHIVQQRYKAA